MSKSMKPAVKPTATESQETKIMRAFAMKREAIFQLILGNLLHQQGMGAKEAVDHAIEGANYAIEKLFNIKLDNSDGNK